MSWDRRIEEHRGMMLVDSLALTQDMIVVIGNCSRWGGRVESGSESLITMNMAKS